MPVESLAVATLVEALSHWVSVICPHPGQLPHTSPARDNLSHSREHRLRGAHSSAHPQVSRSIEFLLERSGILAF